MFCELICKVKNIERADVFSGKEQVVSAVAPEIGASFQKMTHSRGFIVRDLLCRFEKKSGFL